jgi:hypothetical protein
MTSSCNGVLATVQVCHVLLLRWREKAEKKSLSCHATVYPAVVSAEQLSSWYLTGSLPWQFDFLRLCFLQYHNHNHPATTTVVIYSKWARRKIRWDVTVVNQSFWNGFRDAANQLVFTWEELVKRGLKFSGNSVDLQRLSLICVDWIHICQHITKSL